MDIEDRLFVRNKDMWFKACSRNYRVEYIPKVFEINKGIVLPAKYIPGTANNYAGGVCDENFKFKAGLRRDPKSPGWGGVGESYTVDKKDLIYEDETVVFGGVLMSFFGHMLNDNLTRMWWHVLNQNCSYRFCFIVTMGEFKTWMYDFYELLGIDRSRIIIVDKPMQFTKVIVPEEAAHTWDSYTDFWDMPHILMAENALKMVDVSQLPKKIYLTKRFYRDGGSVTINEEYFENFYKSQGYEVIAPEKLPLFQQVALAANAEAIATTLGTTVHFSLFSKKGTRIDILTRVDHQTLQVQSMINQLKQLDYYIVDVSMNYLPCDRVYGIIYLDKTYCWRNFIEKIFDQSMVDCEFDSSASRTYLLEWTRFFLENPYRFNFLKLGEVGGYDILKRMCNILLDKEPDQSKYNVQYSPQQVKITVNQLQKSVEDTKKQLTNAQAQLTDKMESECLLQNEKAKIESDLKKVICENTVLCEKNIQLDKDIKEEKNKSKTLQNENKILQQEYKSLQEKNSESQEVILKAKEEISERDKKIIHLEQSISFRLGMAITFIPRKIKGLFRKRK
ncbi:MAG: glycosyltransferase 61 family protein [Clostridia bacterium]|nr:glycosyltransferase 61 family protein [Clostridia bacterium]